MNNDDIVSLIKHFMRNEQNAVEEIINKIGRAVQQY